MGSNSQIAIFYATKEGQTKRIAEHVASRLRSRAVPVDVRDVADVSSDVSLRGCRAVILAASVHLGRHEREMVDFIKHHRGELERLHTAFLSVSLSEASAEMAEATPAQRSEGAAKVRAVLDAFRAETGWSPTDVKPVAGALLYSQYGFIVRFVMRSIARRAGTSTDTSRDVEYTDWKSLDAFVDEVIEDLDAEADANLAVISSPSA